MRTLNQFVLNGVYGKFGLRNQPLYNKAQHQQLYPSKEVVIVPIQSLPQAEQVYNCAVDLVGLWLDSRWEYNADESFQLMLAGYIEKFLDDDAIGMQSYWNICLETINILLPSLTHALYLPEIRSMLGRYRLTKCFKIDGWSVVLEFQPSDIPVDDLY